ncbi:MAG: group II intron reverse transcriptase/maturase [Veillonellales bacterium]
METKLARIAEVARAKPEEKFTSLAHLINAEMIEACHKQMDKRKAVGIDEVSKGEYENNLAENINDLLARMKRQAYKPQSVRRVYIPKPGTDKKRPLGIPAYEDKLVQLALAKILNAIYEQDFLECSFGFRPQRSCHDALKVLNAIVNKPAINYVVDADIKGFFDHVDHEWMMKFIKHRIADPNIQRLISRFMKAGVMEVGIRKDTPEGVPQGGPISPILANVYLHYVMDLWFEKRIRRQCKGSSYMVRYADDAVFCFQYENEAKEFYQQLIMRLKEFNLEIAAEKTKIISLGKRKNNDNDNTPGNFDFLGFTHYSAKNSNGQTIVRRKTSKKKYRASLLRVKEWLKTNRHEPIKELMQKLRIKLQGYCRYYGVTGNRYAVGDFIEETRQLLYKWLNRRSQRKSLNWVKFELFLKKYPLFKAHTFVNIFELGIGKSYIM